MHTIILVIHNCYLTSKNQFSIISLTQLPESRKERRGSCCGPFTIWLAKTE